MEGDRQRPGQSTSPGDQLRRSVCRGGGPRRGRSVRHECRWHVLPRLHRRGHQGAGQRSRPASRDRPAVHQGPAAREERRTPDQDIPATAAAMARTCPSSLGVGSDVPHGSVPAANWLATLVIGRAGKSGVTFRSAGSSARWRYTAPPNRSMDIASAGLIPSARDAARPTGHRTAVPGNDPLEVPLRGQSATGRGLRRSPARWRRRSSGFAASVQPGIPTDGADRGVRPLGLAHTT